MGLNFKIDSPDWASLTADTELDIARGTMRAMDRATVDVKADLGEQLVQSGFSARLAKAWDRSVYPQRGKVSLNPAGVVTSKAPEIMDAFTRGATIKPVNGSNFLWIPTKNVPKARRRVLRSGGVARGGAMTPEEVEDRFGDFIIRPTKGQGLVAFVPAILGRNNRSERRATKGRRAQGREERLVAMFVLRRSVKMPKLLSLEVSAEKGMNAFVRYLGEEIGK